MTKITTHILDTSSGLPGAGVNIELFEFSEDRWIKKEAGVTNEDGRLNGFDVVITGEQIFKLLFHTAAYYEKRHSASIYPFIEIVFKIREAPHYHIPLLISPYGYTTYRGS